MSALGRNLGNFIQTFSNKTSSFNTVNGLKRGLLPCCGSTIRPIAKDNHHHQSPLLNINRSSISGIRTELFNSKGLISQFQVRQYCSESKLQVSPTPKSLLTDICEREITDFKTIFSENGNEIDTFLEEFGFELTKDGEQAVLKKTFADGTNVVIRFETLEQPIDDEFDENEGAEEHNENEHDEDDVEEQEEEEVEEEEENNEEAEEGEEGEEGEENEDSHEHPFEVEITPQGNTSGKLTFGCYASHDGNYTISGFYKGGFGETVNPVDIGGTSAEFQDNILLVLQQYDINERLSFFIHDYVHNKKINDYVESFEALKDFVSKE
ncbi:hypothetical protein ACTA71_001498 [Dictyostelium dimigraforme]